MDLNIFTNKLSPFNNFVKDVSVMMSEGGSNPSIKVNNGQQDKHIPGQLR